MKTPNIERYQELQGELEQARNDKDFKLETFILDRMDEAWWKLSNHEVRFMNKEVPNG